MKYIVMDMIGNELGLFGSEDEAHRFADEFGERTGNYAFVEVDYE
jgi:hypothetical protein